MRPISLSSCLGKHFSAIALELIRPAQRPQQKKAAKYRSMNECRVLACLLLEGSHVAPLEASGICREVKDGISIYEAMGRGGDFYDTLVEVSRI